MQLPFAFELEQRDWQALWHCALPWAKAGLQSIVRAKSVMAAIDSSFIQSSQCFCVLAISTAHTP
jgi:hypothetical protein